MVKESSICVLDYETVDLIANNLKKNCRFWLTSWYNSLPRRIGFHFLIDWGYGHEQ